MNSSERYSKVFTILSSVGIVNSELSNEFFKEFTEEDFEDSIKVKRTLTRLSEYLSSSFSYPEYVMRLLRRKAGLNEIDVSQDLNFDKLSKEEVFSVVLYYEGLGSYECKIKDAVRDVYGVRLEKDSASFRLNKSNNF